MSIERNFLARDLLARLGYQRITPIKKFCFRKGKEWYISELNVYAALRELVRKNQKARDFSCLLLLKGSVIIQESDSESSETEIFEDPNHHQLEFNTRISSKLSRKQYLEFLRRPL